MESSVIIGIILVVVIGILAAAYISISNGLKTASLKVDEAESGIDVALTKRFDVLTKMLDVVKEYKNYEKETILETVKLRKGMSMQEKKVAENEMNKLFSDIKLVAEAYPQLQAAETFRQLQVAIMDTEEHLQAATRAYNSNETIFNTKVVTFPSSIVAGNMGLSKRDYFEAETSKRQDVEMKF